MTADLSSSVQWNQGLFLSGCYSKNSVGMLL